MYLEKPKHRIILKGESTIVIVSVWHTETSYCIFQGIHFLCFCFFPFYLSCYIHLLLTLWMIGLVLSQGNEYEPLLGNVTQNPHLDNAICWVHGNFVARKKGSGVFSFLTTPRSVFYFELAYMDGFKGVVTCTTVGMVYFLLARCIFSFSFSSVFVGRSCISFASAKL